MFGDQFKMMGVETPVKQERDVKGVVEQSGRSIKVEGEEYTVDTTGASFDEAELPLGSAAMVTTADASAVPAYKQAMTNNIPCDAKRSLYNVNSSNNVSTTPH